MSRIKDLLRRGDYQAVVAEVQRLSRNAAEHGTLDSWVLDDLKADAPGFKKAMERPFEYEKDGKKVAYDPSADVRDDLFYHAHTSGESRVKSRDDVLPSHQFGRDVQEKFIETDAHRSMKPYLQNDALASAIYARAAGQKFEELMTAEAEQIEQSQEMGDLENICTNGKPGGGRPGGGKGATDGTGQKPFTDEQIEEAARKLAEMEANRPKLTPQIEQGIEQAAQEGKEKAEAWTRLAGIEPALAEYATPDEALKLTETWMQMPEFAELTNLIGRVTKDFRGVEAREVVGGDEDVTGITTGNNLPNTLPSEKMALSHPLLSRKFLKDFVDEALLEHETTGEDRLANGPGVFCMDISGSMDGQDLLEAKAVAIAFIRLMHHSRRDAIVICFNSAVAATFEFSRRGPLDMEQLMKLASIQACGGTSIASAVSKAKAMIEKKPVFKKADVVVITDGGSGFGDRDAQVKAWFAEKGVRSHGVSIGGGDHNEYLHQFCDDYVTSDDMLAASGAIAKAVQ